MPSQQQILLAIDKVYDTALDPTRWTELLRLIGALVGAPQGSLMLSCSARNSFTDYGYGRNEEMIALYNTQFVGQDPWVPAIMNAGAGVVMTGQEMCPTKNFEKSAVYQECMKLDDVYDCLGVILESRDGYNAGVVFQRPQSLPVFTSAEKKLLALFVSHLQRVIQIHRRFESISVLSALQTDVLNRLSFGVMIVDRTGVRFANDSARKIIVAGDGMRAGFRGLTADNPADNDALGEAQRKALRRRTGGGAGPRGATIAIRKHSMKRPYSVTVMPLDERIAGGTPFLDDSNAACLVVITDPEATPIPAIDALVQGYGLTPTEAKLALKIGQGVRLQDAADGLAISAQTARWHLKNAFAKTETRRQSELVGLLISMTLPVNHAV